MEFLEELCDLVGVFKLTFDSQAMPAIEIPSRQVTVMMPMIRISLVLSTMATPCS